MNPREVLRTGLIWSGVIMLVMLLASAYAWVKIPAGQLVATHWGIDGQPNGYMGKAAALLILPLVSLGLALLFVIFTRIEPRRHHLEMSMKAYRAVWIGTLLLLAAAHGHIIATALGYRINVFTVVAIGLGLLLVIIGNYLGKVRSNFFFGIRTPWTLSSELSWAHTHRFGGKLFMLIGAIIALGVLLNDPCLWTFLLMGEMLLMTVMLSIYSYLLWRVDPERKNGPAIEQTQPAIPPSLHHVAILTIALTLGMAALAGVTAASTQAAPANVTRARAMIEAQSTGNFPVAEEHFTAQMKAAAPPAALEKIWTDLITQYGPYQRIAATRTQSCWPYTQVFVDVRFAKATVTMKVVFNHASEVAGLWFAGVK